MTLTVEDDFREFVVACWPDLESAALLVTLDPERARVVTADSLADLHRRWREALDEGVPWRARPERRADRRGRRDLAATAGEAGATGPWRLAGGGGRPTRAE